MAFKGPFQLNQFYGSMIILISASFGVGVMGRGAVGLSVPGLRPWIGCPFQHGVVWFPECPPCMEAISHTRPT